jgi:uncharacterized SAM-binding protein YcdF (DUF218 family)
MIGMMIALLIVKNPKRKKRLLIMLVVFTLFFSNSVFIDEALRLWEFPVTKNEAVGTYDVGVVLSGGMVTEDTRLDRLTFQNNTDRILQAVDLYKAGHIKKILISGGSGSLVYRNMLESVLLKKYFVRIGIPAADILIDSVSDNTYENAVNTAKILNTEFAGGSYLLITSAFHMRRSLACFYKQGLYLHPYATNKLVGIRRWDISYLIIPSIESMGYWEKLTHEIVGYIVYDIKGYI